MEVRLTVFFDDPFWVGVFERTDGGKLTDVEFLKKLPKKYVRAKLELNKAKIKADALDSEALAKLGLVRVTTMSMKLKAKSAA